MKKVRKKPAGTWETPPKWKQLLITAAVLAAASGLGWIFRSLDFTEANIITVYILGVLLTALFTRSYICSGLYSLFSVLLFNFFFTEPRLSLHAYESGYPVTFAIMLIAALITGTLAMESQRNAKEKEDAAVMARNEKLRNDLLRSISHDLRTPLTSISGSAENLLANSAVLSESERKALLEGIYDDSVWLIGLVENLLATSRLDSGSAALKLSSELVEDVAAEALRHMGRRTEKHTVELDMGDELLLAQMDARLISQVLINLVDNAVKYTPPGSLIKISARKQGSHIAVSVADNGPGIAHELQGQVFDMFFTGDSKVSDCRRSMGLGLALCKSIINLHGGEIELRSNRPSGCIFSFTLPASEVKINE